MMRLPSITEDRKAKKKNDLSDWIFSHNTTDSLEISSDNTLISKNGGSCTIIVKRNFTKHKPNTRISSKRNTI